MTARAFSTVENGEPSFEARLTQLRQYHDRLQKEVYNRKWFRDGKLLNAKVALSFSSSLGSPRVIEVSCDASELPEPIHQWLDDQFTRQVDGSKSLMRHTLAMIERRIEQID
jgi:hypothetical protein